MLREKAAEAAFRRALSSTEGQAAIIAGATEAQIGVEIGTLAAAWEIKNIVDFDQCGENPLNVDLLDHSLEPRPGKVGLQEGDILELSLSDAGGGVFPTTAFYQGAMRRVTSGGFERGHLLKIYLPAMDKEGNRVEVNGRLQSREVNGTFATRYVGRRSGDYSIRSELTTGERIRTRVPGINRLPANREVRERHQAEVSTNGKFAFTEMNSMAMRPDAEILLVHEAITDVPVQGGSVKALQVSKIEETGCWLAGAVLKRTEEPLPKDVYVPAAVESPYTRVLGNIGLAGQLGK